VKYLLDTNVLSDFVRGEQAVKRGFVKKCRRNWPFR
jgi:predicted nucleic acid-binding protein